MVNLQALLAEHGFEKDGAGLWFHWHQLSSSSQIHSVHCEQIQNQILKDFDMMASVDPGVQETPPARVLTLLVQRFRILPNPNSP